MMMMKVLVMEMMSMMIPMMPGVIAMTMMAISLSGREFPRQISPCWGSSSLCLVSASRRRRNFSSWTPPMFLGQKLVIR